MGISPVSKLFIQINIFLPDIKSAHVSHFIVNDHNFPVVAVIDTKLKPPQDRREKLRGLHTLFIQPFPVAVPHGTTAHGIEQNPDLHTLCRLLDQNILDLIE